MSPTLAGVFFSIDLPEKLHHWFSKFPQGILGAVKMGKQVLGEGDEQPILLSVYCDTYRSLGTNGSTRSCDLGAA